ncbi:MAG: energy-coupling factor transporter transmembrane protein EcfT [Clostridia bacterium]|nr:energy-coupling factor transporter transmembrane protein EcfT [Clostridia bacterium]
MKSISAYNPIVICIYYLSAAGILMFSQNPILLLFGAIGAIAHFLLRNGQKNARSHLYFFLIFIVLGLVNPLVSHNGKTVLFVINDAPITLEATVYGFVSAGILVTVFYLFRTFTDIMTRDKLLYVFGRFSPKVALVLSMGLRYVPLFRERAKKITETQKALGLYKDDNIFDKLRCDLRVFSILITWALENGITTADSMEARAYGTGKRTYYSRFRFGTSDILLLCVIILCTGMTALGLAWGALDFAFYPMLTFTESTPLGIASYLSYGILMMIPIFAETGEKLKWQYLRSKI